MELKDSGARRVFETGAQRDIAEGKGRMDLVPMDVTANYLRFLYLDDKSEGEDEETETKRKHTALILDNLEGYKHTANLDLLYACIGSFQLLTGKSFSDWMIELSMHYEDGARKYEDRNWEKGIPEHCFIDSASRHFIKFIDGWDDEPHDRAFIWNIFGAIWTRLHKPGLWEYPITNPDVIAHVESIEDTSEGLTVKAKLV